MARQAQEAEERERFYEHLFSLDDDDDDNENLGLLHQRSRRRSTQPQIPPDSNVHGENHPRLGSSLIRAHTEPSPRACLSPRNHGSVARPTTADIVQPALLDATLDGPPYVCTAKGEMPNARSRKAKPEAIPEGQHIFRGLFFYFVPNDNVGAARRRRIAKAEQYGAVRAKTWDKDVTHVIVDKDITFEDVLKHLKLEDTPKDIAFVNEDYPAECIGFRAILDTSSSRFRVSGQHSTKVRQEDEQVLENLDAEVILRPSTPRRSSVGTTAEGQLKSQATAELGSEVQDSQEVSDAQSSVVNGDISTYQDDLSYIIQDVKKTSDLPLDLEEDSRPSFTSSVSLETAFSTDDEGTQEPPKKKNRKNTTEDLSLFSCMHKSEGDKNKDNPNARTIDVLQEMATYYDRVGDSWRTRAYRKAISELRKQDVKIITKEQAIQLPNVGDRLADKIEEIVWTNRLRRLEATSADPNEKILQLFMGVYHAGYPQALKWIAQGHRTLIDLQTKAELTANQKIGVEHYADFLQRIPRSEVAAHSAIVQQEALKEDPNMTVITGGSYRRGSLKSGDIDLLITKEGASMSDIRDVMLPVIDRLKKSRFLVAELAAGHDRGNSSKWHGACCLAGTEVWRRIDLLFVPWESLGAALIYFTGNDIFNRSIRLLASRKGMRLNQHGLYGDVMRGPQRSRLTEGRLIEGQDEKRIFEILGVPYRPPEHRIC